MADLKFSGDVPEGSKQPVSADLDPKLKVPFKPGDAFKSKNIFQTSDIKMPEMIRNDNYESFAGKYYRGSATDPSQRTIQGENQPWLNKLFGGVISHIPQVATKLISGAGNLGGGIFDAVSSLVPGVANDRKKETGSYMPHLFENFITKGMESIDQSLEKIMPVYADQKYFSGGFLNKLGDAKFWGTDIADFAAFGVSLAIPGTEFAKIAKGMGMVAEATEGAKALGGIMDFVKPAGLLSDLSTKGRMFTQAGTALWNTTMMSAQGGLGVLQTTREKLAEKYYKSQYANLNKDQQQRINQEAGPYAANAFNANAAILLGPDLIMSRMMIGPVKSTMQRLSNGMRTGIIKPEEVNILKEALWKTGLATTSGTVMMGSFGAVQKYEQSVADKTNFLKRAPGYVYEFLSNLSDTEQKKQMLLGGVMGMAFGMKAGVQEAIGKKAAMAAYKNIYDKELKTTFPTAQNTFLSDIRHMFREFDTEVEKDGKKIKTKTIINPDTGNPEYDMDKVVKMYNASMFSRQLMDSLMMANITGDESLEKFALNTAASQLAYKYFSSPIFRDSKAALEKLMADTPIDKLAEDKELKDAGFDFDDMQNKLRQAKTEWDESQKKTMDKESYLLDPKDERHQFDESVQKGSFYHRMKLRWLDEIDPLVEDKEDLRTMREDSQKSLDILENKTERDKLYKEWQKSRVEESDLDKRYKEEQKKDPNSLETKKYKYLKDEQNKIYGNPKLHDIFSITQMPTEMTGDLGLKNQHYFNIGADAMTGARLESAMNDVRSGLAPLNKVVDILDNPAEGLIKARGKYDVTESDINKAKELIPAAQKIVDNERYPEEDYQRDRQALESQKSDPESQDKPEDIDKAIKALDDKYDDSIQRQKDLDRSIDRLNQMEGNKDGKGLLNYKDGIRKGEKDDDIFLRNVAEIPIRDAKDKINTINNTEAYSNFPAVNKILSDLKDRKAIYEGTDLKDRLSKKSFDGFLTDLNNTIKRIEKILPKVEENYKVKQNQDRTGQINRNRTRWKGLGIDVDEGGSGTIADQETYDKLASAIGVSDLKKIIDDAKEASQVGDEYGSHEAFVDKILQTVREAVKSKSPKKAKEFIDFIGKKYDKKLEEFRDHFNSILTTKGEGITIGQYMSNPRKIFKDVIEDVAGAREEGLTRRTSIDKFKNNNDIYEFRDNLTSEDETGYNGFQKDKLLGLIDRQIEIESLEDINSYFDSKFDLDTQRKLEKEEFIENGKAPTNQQLNTIRQVVRWFTSPDKVIKGEKSARRFGNWLFVKGNAGTGKTQVMIRYMMRALGLKANDVQMFAPSDNAVGMLEKNTISNNKPLLINQLESLGSDIKLVVIDEIAAINNPDLITLSNKLQELNDSRDKDHKFRVISLGDPNQVSAQENSTRISTEPIINKTNVNGLEHLQVVDPLTIRHRSILPEINEMLDNFEDNYDDVKDLPVYASGMIGSPSIGVHAGDIEQMHTMIDAHKGNGKSKVIVVATDRAKGEFLARHPEFGTDPDKKIFTFSEVAGTEFDESYVALSKDQFKDPAEFNKANYTAASRAKQYVFLNDKTKTFKNVQRDEMNKAFKEGGDYQKENQKILDERKKQFEQRQSFEEQVMKGIKPTKTAPEVEKEVEKETDKVLDNLGNRDVGELYIDPGTDDHTGIDEDTATNNVEKIESVSIQPDKEHRLKYPSYVGTRFVGKKETSLSGKLTTGGDVIYIKTEDKTKQNPYTVQVLGQLYDNNGKPIANRYAHLGILGNEELESDLGLELTKNASKAWNEDGEELFAKMRYNQAEDVISLPDGMDDRLVLMRGKTTNISPLSYTYDRNNVTHKGTGMFDKIIDLVNHKYFGRKDVKATYGVKIFSQKELSKPENADLKKKKFMYGVPYLIVNALKKNEQYQEPQFIRLNPVNLSKNHNIIVGLRKFTDAIDKIEHITGVRGRLGQDQFNEMVELFKGNFGLNGDKVEYQNDNLKYNDYKDKASQGYVPDLTKAEFNIISKLIEPIISGIYGKGLKRVRVKDEAEMIDKYKLDKENKTDADNNAKYQFKQEEGQEYGHVIKFNASDTKDPGKYEYEDGLKKGAGEAQKMINILAKANESVSGHRIRVKTLKNRTHTGEMKRGEYVLTGKSLLNSSENHEGYYSQLRQLMKDNDIVGTQKITLSDGREFNIEVSPFIDSHSVKDAENTLKSEGVSTQEDIDQLRHDHITQPITSDILHSITDKENFDKGSHKELRTPLIMEKINEWGDWEVKPGRTQEDINTDKAKLETVLQSNIKDIEPTSVGIQTDHKTKRFDDQGKRDEVKPKATIVSKKTVGFGKKIEGEKPVKSRHNHNLKLLEDNGPVYLGRKVSRRSVERLIKRSIPELKGASREEFNKIVQFVDKEFVNRIAKERGIDKAWGAYKDGIIYLTQNGDGTVWDNIARHEVFHKVFNEYLTPKEQAKVQEMAMKEFGDYNHYIDLEECLADKYHNWKRGTLQKVSDYFKALFMRFQRLFNYSNANIQNIDDLFVRTQYGLMDYRRSNGDNVTRFMREIARKFGSVDSYLNAADYLIREFRDHRLKGINGIYGTHKEIADHILQKTIAERDYELGEYNKLKFESDPELYELAQEHRQYVDKYNNIIDSYKDLVKDIFPGIRNFEGGIFQSKLTEDIKSDLKEERDHPTGKTFIENDRHNTELDVSDEVKEFLSYIEDRNGELLSWRYAYVKMLNMFDGLSFEQGNIMDQIRESFKTKDLSENEKALLNHIGGLWENLESDINDRGTKIDPRYKYIDGNTFIFGDKSVDDIKSRSDERIRNGDVKMLTRNNNETSADFADRILRETKNTTRDVDKSFAIKKEELDKIDFKDEDITKAKEKCIKYPKGGPQL